MSIEETEQASAALAIAPRMSLASIEAKIASKHFINAGEAVDRFDGPLSLMTICLLEMDNGFVVVGKSTPVSAANFNVDLGKKFAYEDCIRQLWPLTAFSYLDQIKS
jgi:hypothetical protein